MAAVWIALALALGLARAEEPERAIPTLEGLASAPGASGLERTYREGIPEHLRDDSTGLEPAFSSSGAYSGAQAARPEAAHLVTDADASSDPPPTLHATATLAAAATSGGGAPGGGATAAAALPPKRRAHATARFGVQLLDDDEGFDRDAFAQNLADLVQVRSRTRQPRAAAARRRPLRPPRAVAPFARARRATP